MKGTLDMDQIHSFSFLLAAISHDLGHPGVNNPFLINTIDKLAIRYNDKSILENMHVEKVFTLHGAYSKRRVFLHAKIILKY